MSLDEKVHTALKSLIDTGLVHDVHAERHARYVEGGPVPDEVNICAVLDASDPDEHRTEIETLLQNAGFERVIVHLHGTALRRERLLERPADDSSVIDEGAVRERANRLWEAEGRPAGRGEEYWFRAQELIDDESQASYPPSQSRGNRT
jgi:hypothetical protein